MRRALTYFALTLLAVPAFAQTAAPAADAAFVRQASASGLAEVAIGKLGAAQGQSDAVKTFGAQMVRDHEAANDELKTLATRKQWTIASMPVAADQSAAAALAKLQGTTFDQKFAQKMVADHKAAVELFRRESTSGSDPDLKAFAAKTLPTLEHHLEMAKQLPGATH
jgi:putative membrane protein